MSKVLYIVANPSIEETSYCLSIGRAFLNTYIKINPRDEIIELDLYKMIIPLIDSDVLTTWINLRNGATYDSLNFLEKQKVASIDVLTEQFMSADKYIFV